MNKNIKDVVDKAKTDPKLRSKMINFTNHSHFTLALDSGLILPRFNVELNYAFVSRNVPVSYLIDVVAGNPDLNEWFDLGFITFKFVDEDLNKGNTKVA